MNIQLYFSIVYAILLLVIIILNLFTQITKRINCIISYADDITIFYSPNGMDVLLNTMNSEREVVTMEQGKQTISLNTSKVQFRKIAYMH